MKVYSCPAELPAPEIDFNKYDPAVEKKREEEHMAALKAWMIARGMTGPHTGKILHEPFADGHASYMLADGKGSFLIHLPYGDAWHSPNVQHLPKAEVLKRIGYNERLIKLFEKKAG